MQFAWCTASCLFILAIATSGIGQDMIGTGSLHQSTPENFRNILPSDSHLLLDPPAIERFLDELDRTPPDWPALYGHGHHDPDHDDRLFALNRERDAKRKDRPALSWRVSFAWHGELSDYDHELGGFAVALGPKFIPTRWGIVRFKPEDVPGNLRVTADGSDHDQLQQKRMRGEPIDIEVLMTGHLIPDESLVYDFSHEKEGLGLIMPFVRVERVDYFLVR